MKIKRIKKLQVPSGTMVVRWDKKHSGGSVSFKKGVVEIGVNCENDAMIFDTVVHEVSEIAHLELYQRYDRPDCEGDYLFNFNHAGHAAHSGMVAGMLAQFIG